jgi:cyclophilin family peptidyl-prolyl cis-trans isomerase
MMFKKSAFDPDYTPFGHIITGLDVIDRIAAGGTDPRQALLERRLNFCPRPSPAAGSISPSAERR